MAMKRSLPFTFSVVLAIAVVGFVIFQSQQDDKVKPAATTTTTSTTAPAAFTPELTTTDVLTDLSHPWDIGFLPDKTLLFTERSGEISYISQGKKKVIGTVPNIEAQGEGGLTGLAIDTNFSSNRYIYTCYNARVEDNFDVRVVRFTLAKNKSSLTKPLEIIAGIPSNESGRHSGCRLRMDTRGSLWIGTGDAANEKNPQSPTNLGGKILHVSRDGEPLAGNMKDPFDHRIFSYGHRNVQGIALFDKSDSGVYGITIEHGPDKDDEINLLQSGNFGWNPGRNYNENVSMTNTRKYRDAITAIWSSGDPTIAPSGATFITGANWGTFEGDLAVAVLKAKQLKLFKLDKQHRVLDESSLFPDFGRLRSATMGPDGKLYLTTDNGDNDKIIAVTPKKK